ncbi:MAG: hypothetical protein AAF389_15965 [Gemmatimonadota bacterium]
MGRSHAMRITALLFLAVLTTPVLAEAQSAQRYSFQFSALGSWPFGGRLDGVSLGVGWEAQLRVTPSQWSFGFGAEQTFHDDVRVDNRSVTLFGGFFEPRYVVDVGSDKAAPYISARFALSQLTLAQGEMEATANGYTINGGGGVLVALNDRVNLDLGATLGYKDLGSLRFMGVPQDFGTGVNAIARVGLAVGLGG